MFLYTSMTTPFLDPVELKVNKLEKFKLAKTVLSKPTLIIVDIMLMILTSL